MRSHHGAILLLLFTLLVLLPLVYLKKNFDETPRFHSIPITLLSQSEQKLYHTDLETYLIGVVAAEMPANFSPEALKAQAVAARTVAVKRLPRFGGQGCRHYRGADFCDDPGENQAWLSTPGLIAKWGKNHYREYYLRVYQAVRETEGIIMTYQDRPIDAVFHSTCGFRTASAMEVWHHQVPYLQSESCGYDSHSPRFRNAVFLTWDEMASKLNLPRNTVRKIKIAGSFPADGRVAMVAFQNNRMNGIDFRKIMGLASTRFSFQVERNGIRIEAIGYGHGVGLCQYGADGMAKQGWRYPAILKHYYRGVELRKVKY